MQNRMKTHSLTSSQVDDLLIKTAVGDLATIDADGTPYITPVHYVYFNDKIYIHGLDKGQKVDNILRDGRVCFSVFDMHGLIIKDDGNACNVNTDYDSVIIKGTATMVQDLDVKKEVLRQILLKYTPQLVGRDLPDGSVKATGVIEISIDTATGKYYK